MGLPDIGGGGVRQRMILRRATPQRRLGVAVLSQRAKDVIGKLNIQPDDKRRTQHAVPSS
jgi:hypothetical protein